MTDSNQKVIFWITGPDLHFSIAANFHKFSNAKLYAIYEIPHRNGNFFKNQKFVDFSSTWDYFKNIQKNETFDLDYLSQFEKTYGVNLWKLAINDRYFYRYNNFHQFSKTEILSILTQECKLFEKILNDVKPDFFITFDTPHHFNRLFFEMCKNKGVKTLMFQMSRLGNKCMIAEDPQKLFESNSSSLINKLTSFTDLQNYLKSRDYKKQIKKYFQDSSSRKRKIFEAFWDYVKSNNEITKTHYTYYGRDKTSVLLNKLKIEILAVIRKRFIDKNLQKKIDNQKFIYFPLHVEIEQYTLVLAPFYTNQLELIHNIARSLPIDYQLIVKEHPNQYTRGWRSISEYKEMMDIPNVKLLHPDTPSEEIYKKCSLVISIAGTSSFEAAFYGKSSIIFTDLMYDSLPSVFRIKSIEELPKIIRKALENPPNSSDVEKMINELESVSFDFNFHEFNSNVSEHFFYDGSNTNIDLSNEQMKRFLSMYNNMLEKVTLEHINRINFYTQQN